MALPPRSCETIGILGGPLQTGAGIISHDKIASAGVILPITKREEWGYFQGTRHRAAIGISEQSDSIVIVVSEETRAISLVYEGDIRRGLSLDDLTTELERIYRRKSGAGKKKPTDRKESDLQTSENTPGAQSEPVS